MQKHKFKNDTFGFDLSLIIYDGSNEAEKNKVIKKAKKLGYSKKQLIDVLDNANGVTFGRNFEMIIAFDSNQFKNQDSKKKATRILETLQHECNHIKENILDAIYEQRHRETECSMRISDWCFRKCIEVDFFQNLLA